MKRKSLLGCILIVLTLSTLTACSGDLARRADGTCVFVCNGGGG